ncbi:unnamed protein product [Rotaria sp. Silwood1]|nr:unnamed protein product [Rotaria sp. Silwood1]CAF1152280.1 unnamed protein product [Rotaria sp. Silwood1]CAF1295053.1 unnamed protein product [Rotaria sp. Silwood1]CAF3441197.1 unnamed protein product [Rotaria sp. Silwood1]CAF3462213.1 unnamed protein product [Rotaria sp. Silwood1]
MATVNESNICSICNKFSAKYFCIGLELAAENAQHQLIELINKQKIQTTKELDSITKEIRYRREEEIFVKNDIDQLKLKINQLQKII